jgi:hypothetical protein
VKSLLSFLLCLFLFSNGAIGAPPKSGDEQVIKRENAVWQTVQDLKLKEFTGFLDPGYSGVYNDGVHSRDAEVEGVKQQLLKGFKLDSISTRQVDKQTQILTYKVTIQTNAGGKDVSESYWASSVWHLVGGTWLLQVHSEAKTQ